ncbi:MAG: hypothetical protein WBP61_03980 [Nocardioides sp.]
MTRIATALAAVPLLLVGLGACGDSGTAGSDPGPRVEAAALTGLSEGEQVDTDEYVEIVLAGLEESTTARLSMETSFGEGMSLSADGVVDYTATPPSTEMTMTMPEGVPGGGEMHLISVDGVMYLSMGEMTGGGYWKLDPSDPDGPLGDMGLDAMLDQSDPRAALETVEPAIEAVTFVGAEQVDGRDLDHYELTVDPQRALEVLGGDLPAEAAGAVPETITYDLWLDEDHRFARMAMEYPVLEQTISTQLDVTDWGEEVSIVAPSADQVEDLPSF